jgi:hypothetical protein
MTRTLAILVLILGSFGLMAQEPPTSPKTEKPAEDKLGGTIETIDGGHLIGFFAEKKWPIETAISKNKMELKLIDSIKVDKKGDFLISFKNGDNVKGKIKLQKIKIKTVFATISVPVDKIDKISIRLISGSASFSEIININFAGNEKTPKIGKAAIGISDQDYWNRYSFPYSAHANMTNIKNTEQKETTLTLETQNLTGQWGWTCDDPMWCSFSYTEHVEGYLQFSGLKRGRYDFYLFAHHAGDPNPVQHAGDYNTFDLSTPDKDYGVKSTEASAEFVNLNWKEGIHYIVYRDIEVNDSGKVTLKLLVPESGAKPSINGMQIAFKGL